MSEEEAKQALFDRLEKFASAFKQHELSNIPNITILFDDSCKDCIVGNSIHFADRLTRLAILLDVVRQEVGQLQQQQAHVMDEALLMNLFRGRVPVA